MGGTRKTAGSGRSRRIGPVTDAERDLVAKFVQDQPAELSTKQVNALSTVLRRTKEKTIELIEQARERLIDSAKDYVNAHKKAIQMALANGDAKSLEVAVRGSQWAMENISEGSTRIVDKGSTGPQGTQILIGVKIGGMNAEAADK